MRTSELRVAAIVYFVGANDIHGLVIEPHGNRREPFRVGTVLKMFPRVTELLATLSGYGDRRSQDAAFHDFVDDWGRALLPDPLPEADVLVIIPHHFLHGLPMHAIRVDATHLGCIAGVTYSPSIRMFLHATQGNPTRLNRSWEFDLSTEPADQGPDIPKDHTRFCVAFGADVRAANSSYHELARQFSDHFYNSTLIEDDFLNARFSLKSHGSLPEITPGSSVACMVCHGFVDELRPELSGVLVNGSFHTSISHVIRLDNEIEFVIHDYPFRVPPANFIASGAPTEVLTALELAVGPAPGAELVCLFGCSTARGEPLSCDDVGSLAHQWLKTGAASIIASYWELNVEVLHTWIPTFLNNWIGCRQPKAIAMRETFRQLVGSNPKIAELEWWSLALLGDWL